MSLILIKYLSKQTFKIQFHYIFFVNQMGICVLKKNFIKKVFKCYEEKNPVLQSNLYNNDVFHMRSSYSLLRRKKMNLLYLYLHKQTVKMFCLFPSYICNGNKEKIYSMENFSKQKKEKTYKKYVEMIKIMKRYFFKCLCKYIMVQDY